MLFWKLFPLLVTLIQQGGSVLVERYRVRRAEEERKKAESERRMAQEERDAKPTVVPSNKAEIQGH